MDESAAPLILKPCPEAGTGVHSWLFYAACSAVEAGLTQLAWNDEFDTNTVSSTLATTLSPGAKWAIGT